MQRESGASDGRRAAVAQHDAQHHRLLVSAEEQPLQPVGGIDREAGAVEPKRAVGGLRAAVRLGLGLGLGSGLGLGLGLGLGSGLG